MIIAVVTFNIDKKLTSSLLKEKFLETSPIYKDTPGLIRKNYICCLLYTSPSPRDVEESRMPSSA